MSSKYFVPGTAGREQLEEGDPVLHEEAVDLLEAALVVAVEANHEERDDLYPRARMRRTSSA